jgi:aminoglycoside 3-N-acetyltransferase
MKELDFRDIQTGLREGLGLTGTRDVIAHINVNVLGPLQGGAETLVGAVLASVDTLVMPAFTYQTQIVPQTGPARNAMVYGSADEQNAKAEIFRPDLPTHPDCGLAAEVLRRDQETLRSTHPILSFVAQGRHAREILSAQTHQNPLGPIAWLEAHDGAVLLVGVDQRENYSLHLAAQRAGREGFVRWALTIDDIEELPNVPGCMEGFNAIWAELIQFTEVATIGLARCELIPLRPMLEYAERRIREEPSFLLCDKPSCLSCRERER